MTQNDAMIQPVLAHRVAHDVRSPLTAIQMCADLLARDEPEPRARYIRMIAEQARAINWAMENLVALADAGDRVAAGAQANLGLCLERCCAELVPALAARNISLQQSQLPRGINIIGDEGHITLALRSCGEALLGIITLEGQLSIDCMEVDAKQIDITISGAPLAVTGIVSDKILAIPRVGLVSAQYIIEATGGSLKLNSAMPDKIMIELVFFRHK